MRIKSFNIYNYGPIDHVDCDLTKFNLFFGKNEHGKSLTIEALIKFLLGKDSKQVGGDYRIDQYPSGYINLILKEGEEPYKITEKTKKALPDLINYEPSLCKDLFIIHNSDLNFDDDTDFFNKITGKLTGINTKPIEEILTNLLKNNSMTATGDFTNISEKTTKEKSVREKNLKDRIKTSKLMIEELNKFLKESESKGIVNLESEYAMKNKNYEELGVLNQKIINARNRERYIIGKNHLDGFKKNQQQLEPLSNLNNQNLQEWSSDLGRKIELDKQKTQIKEEILKKKTIISEKKGESDSYNTEIDAQSSLVEKLVVHDEDVQKLKKIGMRFESFTKRKSDYLKVFLTTLIFFGLSLMAFLIYPEILTSILLLVFSIPSLSFLSIFILNLLYKTTYDKLFFTLRTDFSSIGVTFNDFNEYLQLSGKTQMKYNEIKEKKTRVDQESSLIQQELLNDEKSELNIQNNLNLISEIIEKIKKISNMNTIDEYKQNFETKLYLINEINHQEKSLNDILGIKTMDSRSTLEKIKTWEENLKNYEKYEFLDLDIKHNLAFEDKIRGDLTKISEELQNIKREMHSIESKYSDFQKRASDVLNNPNINTECKQLEDVQNLVKILSAFNFDWENKRIYVTDAKKIMEEIREDERKVMKDIFNDPYLKTIFSKITQELYDDIEFDLENKKLNIKRKDGVWMSSDKLSTGTFDQLYFAVRLAFCKKLMKDNTFFLILDDPFIKSDIDRLHTSLKILLDLTNEGCQILYFSAKQEVNDFFTNNTLLSKYIKLFPVDYVKIEET